MIICAVGITLIVSLVVLRPSNSFFAPPPICTIRKNYAARRYLTTHLNGEEDRIKKVGGGTDASYPEGDLRLFNPEEAGKLQGTGSLSDRLRAGADYVPTPPPLPSRSEYDDIVAGSSYTSSDAAASDVVSSPTEDDTQTNERVAADKISPTDISQQQQVNERDDVYAERLLAEEWAAAVGKAAEQSRLEKEQRLSEAGGRQAIDMNVQSRMEQVEQQIEPAEQARRLAEELARIEEEERIAIEEQTRIEEEQLAVAEQARIEAEERMAAEARIEEEKRLAAEEAAEAARPETEVRRFRTLREQFEFEQAEQQRLMRIEAEKDRGIRRDIERN